MATIIGTPRNDNLVGTADSDRVFGRAGNDTLVGGAGNDTLFGEDGNDALRGGRGNDFLRGVAGNDTLDGGAGNDQLFGSKGNDTFNGGAGFDTADYSALGQAIAVLPQGVISKGSLGTDKISNIERIVGTTEQANAIDGSSGTGGASLTVDLSANSLIVNDIPGIGSLRFTIENFVNVTGTPNDDTIAGNSDNNLLSGGDGNDTLTGGANADTFAFFTPSGIDTIKDFNFEEGDIILVDSSEFGIAPDEFDRFAFDNTANALLFDQKQFALLPGSDFVIGRDLIIS